MEHIVGNIGLVFTNSDLPTIRDMITANKVPAPARIGSVAPVDVFVEPGPTGCDPGQTAWFQALNIPTKINKGQIEMISRVHLIHAGNKVTDSQAALLQKLSIRPFSYGLKVILVYDAGAVFDVGVLDVKPEDLITKFLSGVATFASICLGVGLPTKVWMAPFRRVSSSKRCVVMMAACCAFCECHVLRAHQRLHRRPPRYTQSTTRTRRSFPSAWAPITSLLLLRSSRTSWQTRRTSLPQHLRQEVLLRPPRPRLRRRRRRRCATDGVAWFC